MAPENRDKRQEKRYLVREYLRIRTRLKAPTVSIETWAPPAQINDMSVKGLGFRFDTDDPAFVAGLAEAASVTAVIRFRGRTIRAAATVVWCITLAVDGGSLTMGGLRFAAMDARDRRTWRDLVADMKTALKR